MTETKATRLLALIEDLIETKLQFCQQIVEDHHCHQARKDEVKFVREGLLKFFREEFE